MSCNPNNLATRNHESSPTLPLTGTPFDMQHTPTPPQGPFLHLRPYTHPHTYPIKLLWRVPIIAQHWHTMPGHNPVHQNMPFTSTQPCGQSTHSHFPPPDRPSPLRSHTLGPGEAHTTPYRISNSSHSTILINPVNSCHGEAGSLSTSSRGTPGPPTAATLCCRARAGGLPGSGRCRR